MAADDDDDGGVAADHQVDLTLPAYVAPSERNSFRPAFDPVACTKVNDIRFEFDSSVVRPRIANEMKKLAEKVDKYKGARASVFGHADPVGDDDYNKELSGRRALVIYALLVRDPDVWEGLYTRPHGGDNWGIRSVQLMLGSVTASGGAPYLGSAPSGSNDGATIQAVRRYQGDHGLSVDGIAGPITRRSLFLAYMDTICRRGDGGRFVLARTDFLGRGRDAGGKGDVQGCSEFNPVRLFSQLENQIFAAMGDKTERNRENEINRRVLIYLFRPGLSVDPAAWPCPRATEGAGGCRTQFWPDGDARRSSGLVRRQYGTTRDTFACRFYDSIARRSPCEGVKIVESVRIRLFDRDAAALPNAPFRVTSGQSPENGNADAHGFIVVRDVANASTVTVEWRVPDDERKRRDWPEAGDDEWDFHLDVYVNAQKRLGRDRVREMLNNLGYSTSGSLENDVRRFQREYKLTENGDPDDERMQEVLRQVHDECDPERPPNQPAVPPVTRGQ